RHGILPPKEIVRPESARIAMQGVQPKGVDENNEAILPVGKTIKSIFPFYSEATRLGGQKRTKPLIAEELTIQDLEAAVTDVRLNADRIYKEIFEEFSFVSDLSRSLQPEWVTDALESVRTQQKMVVQNLEEKVNQAPDVASDEYMYQDKAEAERELKVDQQILKDIAPALRCEELSYRVWNLLPYHR